jgi:hypothetical protein
MRAIKGGYSMGDIIIEEANYKAFILALANLLLLIAAGAIFIYGIMHRRAAYWLPGIVTGTGFFIGFIYFMIKIVNVKRLLTITRDGIIDSSSLGSIGFISFDVIKEFVIVNQFNKKGIAVIPKNIDNFLSNLSVVKRSLVKRNINSDLPAVVIPVNMAKDMEPEDILSLLQKRLLDYSSLYE